jgi:hypothetical protein
MAGASPPLIASALPHRTQDIRFLSSYRGGAAAFAGHGFHLTRRLRGISRPDCVYEHHPSQAAQHGGPDDQFPHVSSPPVKVTCGIARPPPSVLEQGLIFPSGNPGFFLKKRAWLRAYTRSSTHARIARTQSRRPRRSAAAGMEIGRSLVGPPFSAGNIAYGQMLHMCSICYRLHPARRPSFLPGTLITAERLYHCAPAAF